MAFFTITLDEDVAQALRVEAASHGESALKRYLDKILRERFKLPPKSDQSTPNQ